MTADFPIAHMTFESVPFDLGSIPSNVEDAKNRAEMLVPVRMAGVLLRYDDEQLSAMVAEKSTARAAT